MRVGSQLHAPAALPPGKRPGTHCIGGWMGPRAGLDWRGKYRPHRGFFFKACPGFFPLDPFLYCLNPFVLHVTLRSMLSSLTTNTTQTSTPPVGFEPTILVRERPQTHSLDRAAMIRSPDRPARRPRVTYGMSCSSNNQKRVLQRPCLPEAAQVVGVRNLIRDTGCGSSCRDHC
jgi:hypothetical protein